MDALSDALQACRFSGAVFIDAELSAPWAVSTPSAAEINASLNAEPDIVIPYHLVVEGKCWVTVGGRAMELVAGDVALFPHGKAHQLASDKYTAPIALSGAFVEDILKRRSVRPIRHGGGGEATRLLCGFFALDRWCGAHVVAGLPQVVATHVGSRGAQELLVAAGRRSIEARVTGGPGSDALVCKLSEFLFVDALRQFVSDAEGPLKGWLAGLRDPAISNALALLHRRPQENWDIRALASACAMSRSSFVPRFSKIVGLPPKKYLARWRMILAARDLRDRNSSVMQIADRYGYGSEASFTRAFRRLFDVPPATYRRAEHGRAEVSR
jgi:AraC-like DNA-binding protein